MSMLLFEHAKTIFSSAVKAVRPSPASFSRVHALLSIEESDKVAVVAVGKASLLMLESLSHETQISEAHVTVPVGYRSLLHDRPTNSILNSKNVTIVEGNHPRPGDQSFAAVESVISFVRSLSPKRPVVVLISGGGSSLWGAPAIGLDSQVYRRLVRVLVNGHLPIHDINLVRSRLGRLSGGRLLALLGARPCASFVLSDVPGDDPAFVASGPMIPPAPSEAGRYRDILDTIGIDTADILVPDALANQTRDLVVAEVITIGSNGTALEAAALAAQQLGYKVRLYPDSIHGEARTVGTRVTGDLAELSGSQATCLLYGGESIVRVKGNGRGGRNQELALAAALALDARDIDGAILAAGTDGVDGETPAAGAVVNKFTVADGRRLGRSARDALENNDSYSFFENMSNHLVLGPTHTNVMDIVVALQQSNR